MKNLVLIILLAAPFFGKAQFSVEIQNGTGCDLIAQFAIVNPNTCETTYEIHFVPAGNYLLNLSLPVQTSSYQVEGVRVWHQSNPSQIIPVYAAQWALCYFTGYAIANTTPLALGDCGDRNVGLDGDENNTVLEMQ